MQDPVAMKILSRNEDWHSRHRLPAMATLDQRVTWHMEHARRCPCPAGDADLQEELRRRFRGSHQDFWIDHSVADHLVLGCWAADCAEQLLPVCESRGDELRPREAVRVLREWTETGVFSMADIRRAALGAHAAARTFSATDKVACFAARAAGQAVATAHVPTHAFGVVLYSIKMTAALHPSETKENVQAAFDQQWERLPERLQPWAKEWLVKIFLNLPKNLRDWVVFPE